MLVGSVFALGLVACGDDSTSVADDSRISSEEDANFKNGSSSSVKVDVSDGSSCSCNEVSSGSAEYFGSSMVESSSLKGEETSSSSEEVVRVSWDWLLSPLNDWDFDVPKENFLNASVGYGTLTDKRDGQMYKTVKIGEQVWMAENLNYADSVSTASLKGNSWCFKNRVKNCDVMGRLYTWGAAIDSVSLARNPENPQICGNGKKCTLPDTVQGICPEGWHLPNRSEITALVGNVGGHGRDASMFKSQNGWLPYDGFPAPTDDFGFSAAASGGWDGGGGDFFGMGQYAFFWEGTESDEGMAMCLALSVEEKVLTS